MPPRAPLLHPPDLLARIGRCLSFGCTEPQTRRAAALVRRIAHDGATLRAAQHGALVGDIHGVRRARIELPADEDRQTTDGGRDACASLGVATSRDLVSRVAERIFEQKSGRPPTAEEEAIIRKGSRQLATGDWAVDILEPVKPRDVLSLYPSIQIQQASAGGKPHAVLHAWIWSHVAMAPVAEMRYKVPENLPKGYLKILEDMATEAPADVQGAAEVAAGVRALEKETWDRDDAVEDMGGA